MYEFTVGMRASSASDVADGRQLRGGRSVAGTDSNATYRKRVARERSPVNLSVQDYAGAMVIEQDPGRPQKWVAKEDSAGLRRSRTRMPQQRGGS
jgi:hypothetical protein